MNRNRRLSIQALIAGLIGLGAASGAGAGPNAGGVLVVHDTGLQASGTSGSSTCLVGDTPLGLGDVDARIDGAHNPDDPAIFRVYAVFPEGSAPRLMGVPFGIRFNEAELVLDPAALRHCGDFELADLGWPGPNLGCTVTWPEGEPERGRVTVVYWFAAYQTESGGQFPATQFELIPHPHQESYFGDDSLPARLDAIGGFGRIGFDTAGYVPPTGGDPGACCDPATDECLQMTATECGEGGIFKGPDVPCDPNPCPVLGGCCYPNDTCENNISRRTCEQAGNHFLPTGCAAGGTCSYYPLGACCSNGGSTCTVKTETDCADGLWRPNMDCRAEPVACDTTMGACCIGNGCLVILIEEDCVGVFLPGEDCQPVDQVCNVLKGACCSTDGCRVSVEADCTQPGEIWHDQEDCQPDPCAVPPVERMSWGKLKSLYK